ncbi:MAG: amidohydrolase family protein, partial [Paracoccaceae bacterium]
MSDLIFCDADIITMDESRPHAEAIHIKKNIIENIGSNQEILSKKQHGTKIISAKGKTIMPGFIDSHIHIFPGSDSLGKLNLTNAYTFDEVKNLTQKYINENEDLNFIEGTGVHYSVFKGVDKATRLQLDKIIEDKSLLLIAPDHHSGWANTKALSEASILEGFALPEGNEVVMLADGYAEGMLKENEAIKLVSAQQVPRRSRLGLDTGGEPSPEPNDQERNIDKKILKKGLAHLAKLGITSVHNMDGNFYTLEL